MEIAGRRKDPHGRGEPMGEYEVRLQNQPVDISEEFGRQANHFFVGERTEDFDPASASGKILWKSLSQAARDPSGGRVEWRIRAVP
jgi:hypothetical protein